MNKKIAFVGLMMLMLVAGSTVFAQGSDMVVLKKGENKTLKTYIAGSQIHFINIAGNEVEGNIKKIERDSIFIHTYDSRAAYTMWGTRFWDTVSVSLSRYHISAQNRACQNGEVFSPFNFSATNISLLIKTHVNKRVILLT